MITAVMSEESTCAHVHAHALACEGSMQHARGAAYRTSRSRNPLRKSAPAPPAAQLAWVPPVGPLRAPDLRERASQQRWYRCSAVAAAGWGCATAHMCAVCVRTTVWLMRRLQRVQCLTVAFKALVCSMHEVHVALQVSTAHRRVACRVERRRWWWLCISAAAKAPEAARRACKAGIVDYRGKRRSKSIDAAVYVIIRCRAATARRRAKRGVRCHNTTMTL
jgi:hypothetical protein